MSFRCARRSYTTASAVASNSLPLTVSKPGRSGPAPTTKTTPCAATCASSTTDSRHSTCTRYRPPCTRGDTRMHPVGASGPSRQRGITLSRKQVTLMQQPRIQQRQCAERRDERDHHVRWHGRRARFQQHRHRVHGPEEIHAQFYFRDAETTENSQYGRKP